MKKMPSLPLTPEKIEYLQAYLTFDIKRLEIAALIREKFKSIKS